MIERLLFFSLIAGFIGGCAARNDREPKASETNSSGADTTIGHWYYMLDASAMLNAFGPEVSDGCAVVAFDVSADGYPSNYEIIYSAPTIQMAQKEIEVLTATQFEPWQAPYRNVVPIVKGRRDLPKGIHPPGCDSQEFKKALSKAYVETRDSHRNPESP